VNYKEHTRSLVALRDLFDHGRDHRNRSHAAGARDAREGPVRLQRFPSVQLLNCEVEMASAPMLMRSLHRRVNP
jgi:hypothetical protein